MARIIKSGIGNTVKNNYQKCMVRIGLYVFVALLGASFVYFTYGISLILLLPLLFIKKERTKMLLLKHGIEGEIATTKALKRLPFRYYVCPDVVITNGSRKSQMDHVVVGPNGVFVVETKNHMGVIKGDDNDQAVLQKRKTASGTQYASRFYSPMRQVSTHTRVITRLLEQNGFDIAVQGIVYFSHPKAKVRVYSEDIPIYSAKRGGRRKMLRFIKHSRCMGRISQHECKIIARLIANHR